MVRTAQSIEEAKAAKPAHRTGGEPRKPADAAAHLAPYRFKSGAEWKGNAGGRPKNDVSRKICQAIIEDNEETIYKGLGAQLAKGNAYAFKEVSDRAYGKLKESLDVGITDGLADVLAIARKRAKDARSR